MSAGTRKAPGGAGGLWIWTRCRPEAADAASRYFPLWTTIEPVLIGATGGASSPASGWLS